MICKKKQLCKLLHTKKPILVVLWREAQRCLLLFDQMPLTGRFPAVEDPHLSGDVSIASCDSCGLFQLKQAYSPDLMYEEYFYQSSINNTMRKHLYELVSRILNVYGGHDPRSWLDIGCNDGFLLSLAKLLGGNLLEWILQT